MVYTDKHAYLLVGKESTFNTGVTANKDVGIIQSVSLDETNNNTNHYSIGNRQAEQSTPGQYDASINLTTHFQHGRMMSLMFGADNPVETTTDFKHTLVDVGTTELLDAGDSFTAELGFNSTVDVKHLVTGCKINSVTMTLANPGIFAMDYEIIGTKNTVSAASSSKVISSLNVLPHMYGHISTGADTSEVEHTRMQNFSLTISQGIDAAKDKGIGSRFNVSLTENQIEITFDFTLQFATKTEHERFLGSTTPQNSITDTSIIFNVHNGVTLGSGRQEFYLKVKGGQYESLSTPVELNGIIEQTFSGTARTVEDLFFVDNISAYF
jgi:hypothetical protein